MRKQMNHSSFPRINALSMADSARSMNPSLSTLSLWHSTMIPNLSSLTWSPYIVELHGQGRNSALASYNFWTTLTRFQSKLRMWNPSMLNRSRNVHSRAIVVDQGIRSKNQFWMYRLHKHKIKAFKSAWGTSISSWMNLSSNMVVKTRNRLRKLL